MWETASREQMVDVVAHSIGMDPLEFRRRNVIPADSPTFTNPNGMTYQAVTPSQTLEQAAELIGYKAFRQEQVRARAAGRLVGIGLSLYIEPQPGMGSLGTEAATIRIEPSGQVNVYMSTGTHGQGTETTLAQIVADELGVAFADVRILQGDTASTPFGFGTGGSRNAAISSGAAHQGAAAMRAKVLQIGAHLLEASVDDVQMRDSVITVKGVPGVELPLARVAAAAYLNPGALPEGVQPGLEVSERYKSPPFMYSNACHAVTVEVDRNTGRVTILRHVISEDCGTMINPNIVEGQIAGGSAQAIGGVFYEHLPYDESGNPLATTFMDYLLPTAAEIPDFEYGHIVTPGITPGGYKGMGEGGAICAPAALINAVRDALAPLGVEVNEQPLSPDRLFALMEASGAAR
jgi:carbon-monoxide dehydrogenase large subunit